MFDIGWTELLLIGIVALIVVGPKDLPMMFRTLGRFTGKMRGMAREFQRAMDDAAKESGVNDIAKDLRSAASPKSMGLDKLNAAADRFEKWDPVKATKSTSKMGPETQKLSEERAAAAEKVREATAKRALDRKAAETAKTEPAAGPEPAPKVAEE